MKKIFLSISTTILLLTLSLLSWQVKADVATDKTEALPKITFQVTTESIVPEDRLQVVVRSELQTEKLSKKQSQQLEQRVETLVKQLESYKNIKMVNNHRDSYANYNNQGKISGWTLQAEITLETHDFAEMAALVSELPNNFSVAYSRFFVSPEKRKQQEDEMLKTLLAEVQQQADMIKNTLQREQYRLVNMNIMRERNVGYMMTRESPMLLAKSAAQQDSENGLSFTPGETRLTMSANVVISLSEK